MSDPPIPEDPQDDSPKESVEEEKYLLPHVGDFDGVNKNFDTLSVFVAGIIGEMKNHSEITNQNLTRLAEETSNNLNKLAGDMKAILSSQTMLLSIVVIVIMFMIIIAKGAFDTLHQFWTMLHPVK